MTLKASARDSVKSFGPGFLLWVAVLQCGLAACINEQPIRRSAVDQTKLCANDPERPVFAGQCLKTQANTNGPPETQRVVVQPIKPGSEESLPTLEPGAPTVTPEPIAPTVTPEPSAKTETKAAAPTGNPPKGEGDLEAVQAKEREALSKILEGLGQVLTGNKKSGAPEGDTGNTNPGPETASTSFVVTFSKQSFVGVADQNVVKNCLVAEGTKIVVKGEPQRITQFEELGVEQYVTGEILEIVDSTDSCKLIGKDIVYLGSHASASPKR